MATTAWIWLMRSSWLSSLAGVGVDPHDLGGLVGDRDIDELVQLLVDAALEQRDQGRPGDVGPAAAPQLLDLGKLVEGMLNSCLMASSRSSSCGFDAPLVGADHGRARSRSGA